MKMTLFFYKHIYVIFSMGYIKGIIYYLVFYLKSQFRILQLNKIYKNRVALILNLHLV